MAMKRFHRPIRHFLVVLKVLEWREYSLAIDAKSSKEAGENVLAGKGFIHCCASKLSSGPLFNLQKGEERFIKSIKENK
jgi:FPC/CPF motif-containing protein YcgG